MAFTHTFSNPMETPRPSVFGQPLSNVGTDGSVPWLHTPPTHMPWGVDQPSLVHFTGGHSSDHGHVNDGFCGNIHYTHVKRKIEPESDIMPSPKLHITEDRMAAHMSQLRISSNYRTPTCSVPSSPPAIPSTSKDEEVNLDKIREKQEFKRLFVCDEIRRLKNDLNVLPSALFSKIERPSMALVLWQPPSGVLGQSLQNAINSSRTEEEADNNNSSLVDLNTFRPTASCGSAEPQPSTSRADPEAMDL